MIALQRSLLLVTALLAVWCGETNIEQSFAQEKKKDPKLQEISIETPELWGLRCFPDGSGHLGWAASPNGVHSTSFKAGTLQFQALAGRIRELSRKEAKEYVKDEKVIASDPDLKPGTCNSVFLWQGENRYDSWCFPKEATSANQLLREVFTAATQEKAVKDKGKDFDKVWRDRPPAFMLRIRPNRNRGLPRYAA